MRFGIGAAFAAAGAAAVLAAGCGTKNYTAPRATALPNPDSLTYSLLPGAPQQPAGVLLSWAPASGSSVIAYNIYSRNTTSASWGQIGTTVLTVFEDAELPSLQYYVASQDQYGDVSSGTTPVTVDTTSVLAAPASLTGVSFDSAAELKWPDVAASGTLTLAYYRVYSETPTGSGGSATCPSGFSLTNLFLEGTTASHAFAITGLANGTGICFAVSAVATSGQESPLTAWALVTPAASAGPLGVMQPQGPIVVHGSGRRIQMRGLVVRRA